ncbi:efflux RND transporter permease subunit [Metabacillus arenae]|uniref:Efflux RND transporter permease subunit n=1 Tax=Metabacillus arenae TaxID=2771434 RepID=A0A926RWW7_9BACI|nr:efflux RND transporter permease subunit [Metabacillus arenae]MBD1379562.1 efflux RND transporter permease subunit [Metabacillus arenae]
MNRIINFSLKNKFAVWLLTIIVTVAGIYSGLQMKLETIPNINTPIVTVMTTYPGATPEEVDEKVSTPIERTLQNLNDVNVVNSTSFQNASSIQIEYSFEKDMDEAEQEVEEALTSIKFPEGVQESEVSRLSLNAFPVMAVSISNSEQTLAELTKEVEDTILPKLEGIEGVASLTPSGQQVEEVQLTFKQDKMNEMGLDEETVQNLIKGADISLPLGLYTLDEKQKSVLVDGNITSLDDLKSLEIPVMPSGAGGQQSGQSQQEEQSIPEANGQQAMQGQQGAAEQTIPGANGQQAAQAEQGPAEQNAEAQQNIELPTVTLEEIADIKLVGEAESISRTNGKEAIGLQIVKAADANTVDVVNAVKDELNQFEKTNGDLEIVTTFDQGEPIEESVNTMLSKAIFGAVFAMIIILLFLRNFRTTVISVISIPLSLLIAVLVLNQMDITLNIMTLGAMTVAIGRVIDDSIVVIENIYRRMSIKGEKLKGKDLIREATKEMFMPILSSTIVTIAVFLPLGLVKGMVGEMFLPFALTIVFSLLASLLVAITIVPMMAHSLFKNGVKGKQVDHEKPGKLSAFYKSVLNWSLNHKIITFSIAILMLVGSMALIPVVGVSFLPSEEEKMVIATYNPEPGQTLENVEEIATNAEKYFQGRDGADTIQFSLGSENPMSPGSSNQAMFFVKYRDDTKNFEKEKETVISDLQEQTGVGEWASQDFSSSGASNSLTLYVYGNNMDDIEPVVNDIQKMMDDQSTLKNVDTSISETYEEYTLVADQEKLSKEGLSAGQVGMELSQTRERPVLTTIEDESEELTVYIQEDEAGYDNIDDMLDQTIQTPLGKEIAVRDVMEVKEGETSDTVSKRDGRFYVEVSGEITSDDVAKASADVQAEIDKMEIPSNIDVSMGGVTEDIQESFTQLGLAMLAAIAIVYLILVITFGGGLAPFAILFSLPFTIIGAVLALLISGETLSISALIGALMLIGIVVTNAIVLIDRVIHKENEGLSTRDAILEAGVTRLRPILMTAIATIGALIPLALGLEGSGLISKGLGVTVIGGLTSSTLLTLLIVPIVYELLSRFMKKKKDLKKENAA